MKNPLRFLTLFGLMVLFHPQMNAETEIQNDTMTSEFSELNYAVHTAEFINVRPKLAEVSRIPTIGGVVNFRYQFDELNDISNFDIRRARLDMRGKATHNFDYRLVGDFGGRGARLIDVYIQWQISENIALLAGQYKIPITLEGTYSFAELEMIDFSLPIRNMLNYNDRLADVTGSSRRDIGVSLRGTLFQREDYSLINYFFGVFNGSGINRADINKAKDFCGLLTVNPFKHLSLVVSHYNGTAGQQDSTFLRNRSAVGARYDDGRFLLRSEYVWAKTGTQKSNGIYAIAGYFVRPKIRFTARYDTFQSDMNVPNNETLQQNYTIGINYFPTNRSVLQLNYTRQTFRHDAGNHIAAQVWIRF